jgi:predicted XRE-type DNA-binding protein
MESMHKEVRNNLRIDMKKFIWSHPFSVRRLAMMIGVSRPTLIDFMEKDDRTSDHNTMYMITQFLKNHDHGSDGDEYKPCNYIRDYHKRRGIKDYGKQPSDV